MIRRLPRVVNGGACPKAAEGVRCQEEPLISRVHATQDRLGSGGYRVRAHVILARSNHGAQFIEQILEVIRRPEEEVYGVLNRQGTLGNPPVYPAQPTGVGDVVAD